MSRRPPPAEQQFGSDSFLDVVANVVGILIILMVLAGMRAARAPVILKGSPSAAETNEPDQASPPTDDAAETGRAELAALQSQAEKLQGDLEQLRLAADERETRLSELQSQDAVIRNRLAALGSTLETELSALEQNRRQAEELSAAAQAVRVKLTKRQADVAAAEQQTHRVERLEHRITPVSRVLSENETELHFRCLGGKVAAVPVDDLVERMKTQMERQRDFIIRSRRYAGSVGPVRGFSMHYIVEREDGTTLDSLRAGGGIVRIIVSQWEIVPETDLDAESTEGALRGESVFRNELRKVEPGSTITFWVYPDSFALYRQLQALCHREGFTVAARPMPAGIPIMGSPKGSRSAAQ